MTGEPPDPVFRRDGFLTPDEAARLYAATAGRARAAAVVRPHGVEEVDRDARWVDVCEMPADLAGRLEGRFEALRPELEAWSGGPLGRCEPPQLLAYHPGGHFAPHADAGDADRYPPHIAARAVTAVVFVNGPSLLEGEGGFGGGTLVLFDLSPEADPGSVRRPVPARAGTLVAFPSRRTHAVRPVLHGRRVTVVTWYSGQAVSEGHE